MLDTLYTALVKAVQATESDTISPAYQTVLKDPEFAATVSDILSYAAAGLAIYPPNVFTGGAPSPPVIFCVDRAEYVSMGHVRLTGGDYPSLPLPEEQKRGITKHLEVYDANDILKISPQDAIMNAASYVAYVASIYGNCTDFPSPPGTEDVRRIGLEVDKVEEMPSGLDSVVGNATGVAYLVSDVVVSPVQ
ncbi:MAG: hypothetical protein Q9178_008000 [Gyalolechia marmorata]